MRSSSSRSSVARYGLAASILLLTSGAALAQSVNLTAAPMQALLPDGQPVPMWGYSCTGTPTGATCAAANASAGANWSPVVITVPYTESAPGVSSTNMTIYLTNNLSFGASPNNIPTSIVIDGQLGGGLGTGATFSPSPDHSSAQSVTWPTADPTTTGAPTPQGPRVRSFATEVAATPAATAQTPTPLVWNNLKPGTYLIHSGTHPSIQHPMGLYGVLVVTAAPVVNSATTPPTITTPGTAYPGVTYGADVPLLLSEIDPVQNGAVATAVATVGFNETKVWSGLSLPPTCTPVAPATTCTPPPATAGCGAPTLADGTPNPGYNTCYPPAVNYDPRYYLINGTSFDASSPTSSLYGALPAGTTTGPVLVRFVNAGLRMHVPSIVGATTTVGGATLTTIGGMSLIAEDGNPLPGVPRVQNEVFLAAGKTYDVLISDTGPTSRPVFDRQLSLSTNNQRNGGMLAYVTTQAITATTKPTLVPSTPVSVSAANDKYYLVAGHTLTVSDTAKGLLANDIGVYGATLLAPPALGTVTLSADGTFVYVPNAGTTSDSFTYCANGTVTAGVCSTNLSATVTLAACDTASGCLGGAPTANADAYGSAVGPTAALSARLHIAPPGVLANDTDPSGLPLTVDTSTVVSNSPSLTVVPAADGSFTATLAAGASTAAPYTFTYKAKNSQGTASALAIVTLTFPAASNLAVNLLDAITGLPITSKDYRWIIEEDRTFYVDPACQINSTDPSLRPASCPPLPVQSLGYSFHTANMPVIATGCVGTVSCEAGQTVLGAQAACDQGNGICRAGASKTPLDPSQVALDPTKRYYLSVMPADGINPTINGVGAPVADPKAPGGVRPFDTLRDCTDFTASLTAPGNCGHSMGGAQISGATIAANGAAPVNIKLQRTPLPTAQITAFVFQDDYPLNGENDASGPPTSSGPAPFEAGLGGFNIVLFDQAGGLGDNTGQPTYDMFNMPLTNSLNGTIDPLTGLNACPISKNPDNLIGMIPTCPRYEADATGTPTQILSPLVGQAVIKNLYPGLYEVQAFPAADRIARGEEWLQTNTLDGGKPHEAFIKPNEPGYFQEFGPGGFHVSIGFANPKIINDRLSNGKTGRCDPTSTGGGGASCNASLYGQVTGTHMSRTPDQRTYSSGDYTMYGFTQCYIGIGAPDDATFALAKCDQDGKFAFPNIPPGDYMLTVFDQWNDIMLDGLVNQVCVGTHNYTNNGAPVPCNATGAGTSAGNPLVFPVTQWRTNVYTRTFIDTNGDGVSNVDTTGVPCTGPNTPAGCNANYGSTTEPGLPLVSTNIRYRDGSFGFFNNTDLNGFAGWNEVFPFMNWLVAETTSTRFKQTGTHTVYDAGGPVDGTPGGGSSLIASGLANSLERTSLPPALRVPGAVYCASGDCTGQSIASGPYYTNNPNAPTGPLTALSSARIDPPQPWGPTMGFQSLLGQSVFMEFGMRPLAAATATTPAENGGIQGHVIYASTRPFDDPSLLLQLSWEPGVPRVKVNLYQEGTAPDGTTSLKLVDTTTTTSWDDWAQGFRRDGSGNLITTSYTYTDASGVSKTVTGYVPNMNCPGQDPTSPFFQTLKGSSQWLDPANPKTSLAADSLFKCYDGWSQLNQVQPAPYDGKYSFPSIVGVDPATGRPAGTGTAVSATGGAMPGTNCTTCVANPVDGTPMLASGKYVVEVVVPPGFELVKEEDKNILMGDIYVAPVTQQFAGLGNVFILPDQATVNSHYNKNNPLNPTDNLGTLTYPRHEGDTGSIEAYWPCVGAQRVVPDYNSLYPGVGQTAPFAGASRALCDRKEVTLTDQSTALAKFYVFTPAHIAGHFTGTITNDFASEFDPFSPQFGEKFGPPNLPVGLRDFAGTEVGRVYSDQWGIYNGLYFSSWEVNPPNPTGYAPQMAIACMNDPGPIVAPVCPATGVKPPGCVTAQNPISPIMITDPSYNPAYSNFCYETPFMPGFTAYMDTPVIPTQAFADGYNLPDSEYPDATPAVDSVTGGVAGPWVSAAGQTLTIKCLGFNNTDQCSRVVQNPDFSGPGASTPPYNQKTITRHYGFGGTAGTVALVGADGVPHPLTNVTWTNATITGTVPAGVPNCGLQQIQTQATATTPASRYSEQCGELVISSSTGKRSIDTVTVTIGGKTPTVVSPTSAVVGSNPFGTLLPNPLQAAIDDAAPGDLIIVTPGTYKEHLLMWKPVRLQGVGAASVTVNADAHPSGSLDPWRREVTCAFGLAINGVPISGDTHSTTYDTTGQYSCPPGMFLRGDRIPFEPIVGWDATGNGNLAQVLQEPTLMGAYEGAGITVVGRGIRIPASSTDFWGIQAAIATGIAGAFPDGSVYLNGTTDCAVDTSTATDKNSRDYYSSNFLCNPSRIDGLSITNSSQGGGGIFLHGWSHNLEIGNTRIFGNHGTLTGGINLGNGETPGAYANDGVLCGGPVGGPLCPPIPTGTLLNELIPLQINTHVRVHHNMVYNNAGIGDALFSGTPSGAGGVTISTGGDNYRLDHNWIAGNLSTGDGGGVEHSGQSFNGQIDHNYILFNQSTNPTLPTNGGGLGIIGANNPRLLNGQECGTATDADCPPGLGDGTGKGLVIDSNLILGNSAESGSGGGVRLQQVNGTELTALPLRSDRWYDVTMTNNIIVNNVAGWDGAGVSMEDAFKVSVINNTIASNDTTASAGVLFKTLGAINAASTAPGCTPTTDPTLPQNQNCLIPNAAHVPQPAGLVTSKNTPNMVDALAGLTVVCPPGFGYTGLLGINGNCKALSIPLLTNDLFWENRAFHVEITGAGTDLQSQQNLVAMVPVLNQTSTGYCASSGVGADLTSPANVFYWDVGVRDDVVPNDGAGGARLTLQGSILTPGVTYGVPSGGKANLYPTTPPVNAQYCNGSRVPPENGGRGFLSPPGASETTGVTKLFTFNNIQPAATVDEGHNWINLTYGPLTLTSMSTTTLAQAFSTAGTAMVAASPLGPTLGAYSIGATSAAVNAGTNAGAPALDFFGNPRARSTTNVADIGAVEFQAPTVAVVVVTPVALSFAGTVAGTTSATQTLTLANNGGAAFTGLTVTVATSSAAGTGTFARNGGTCGATLNAGATCTILVRYTAPATVGASATGTVAIVGSVGVINSPVALTGSSAAPTFTARVGPSPLDFGNWATGTTSGTLNVSVLNTGNSSLAGGTFTFGGGTPQPFSRVTTGTFPANAPNCGAALVVGAACTIKVQFAPTTAVAFSRTLTVAYTGASVSPAAVTLNGTGVATRATVSIRPNPLNITLPSTGSTSLSEVGTVTLTNTAPAGTGASMTVTSAVAAGGTLATYLWTSGALAGPNTCTGATLGPGQSCSVTVRFTLIGASRGTTPRTGTITFTDSGAASPQVGQLIGIASQAAVAFRNGTTDTACAGANITTLAWGATSTPMTACVVNTGNGDLNVTAEAIANLTGGAQFSSGTQLPNACAPGGAVAPGGFCTVVINRTAAGAATGSLSVTDTGVTTPTLLNNAPTATQVLSLSGN